MVGVFVGSGSVHFVLLILGKSFRRSSKIGFQEMKSSENFQEVNSFNARRERGVFRFKFVGNSTFDEK